MNIFLHIFRELDRASGRIVRNAARETIKAGRRLVKRVLVKTHRRKGKIVKRHRRVVTVGRQGNYKRSGQAGTRRKVKKAKHPPAYDDLVQAYVEDLTSNPEHQEWLKTHGGLCAINWQSGRRGDDTTFLLSYLLIQEPKR